MIKSIRTKKKSLRYTNDIKRTKKIKSRKRSQKFSRKRTKKSRSRKIKRKSFRMNSSLPSVQKEPIEDICPLIPSHTNNQMNFTDILEVEEIFSDSNSKIFKDTTNGKSFTLIKKHIAEGSNGYVYRGIFNQIDIVVKSISTKTENFEYVIKEMLIQAHLACGHNSELEPLDSLLIPTIYFIAKTKNNNYFIGSEKLDNDLYNFIKSNINKNLKSKIVKDLIFKVSRTLLLLQEKCNFIHGDLHIKNIMYKGDINDPDNLKWYIIDFGMACINIKNTETNSDNIIILSKYMKPYYTGDASHYDSYDLRILFLSLAKKIHEFDYDFQRWLAINLVSPSTYVDGEKSVLFHNAYRNIVSDIYLNPEFILERTEPPYQGLLKENGSSFLNEELAEIMNNFFDINDYSDDHYSDDHYSDNDDSDNNDYDNDE